jgi:hypothetical protein
VQHKETHMWFVKFRTTFKSDQSQMFSNFPVFVWSATGTCFVKESGKQVSPPRRIMEKLASELRWQHRPFGGIDLLSILF